jgi:Sulfotransferase family
MAAAVPILVLASGQRCGSTLIQRLLSSHPDVLVWGEHGGQVRDVLDASRSMGIYDEGVRGSVLRKEFDEEDAHQGWIANLLPGPEAFTGAARAYLETLFAAPAATRGRRRWGFKEVRFGFEEATWVRDLFPDTRVVHVTRDPRKVLISLDSWERGQGFWQRASTEETMRRWRDVNDSFLAERDGSDWVSSWRFEDVVADPGRFTETIAAFLGLERRDLDESVFERPLHGYPKDPRKELRPFDELEPDLRALLDEPELRRVADAYGYELGPPAGMRRGLRLRVGRRG